MEHQATFDYLLHYTTTGADYQLEYNKTYTATPYGVDKVPEFTVRPYDFFQHFIFPISAQLTAGEYSEPSNLFYTWRVDGGIVLGPALAKVFGSDFKRRSTWTNTRTGRATSRPRSSNR